MSARKTAGVLTAAAAAATIALAVPDVAKYEGVWLTAKIDTIGTGRPPTVCYGETEGVKVGDRYTPEQCRDMLAKKLPRYLNEINKCILVEISPRTRASLLSMAYNIGSAGLCRSTTIRKLNAGDGVGACNAMMAWTRAQGRVVPGLVNRRNAERKDCLAGLKEPVSPNAAPVRHANDNAAPVPKPRPAAAPEKPPCRWWQRCAA